RPHRGLLCRGNTEAIASLCCTGSLAFDKQETFLLKLQKSIVARHGFEASDSGVREAMLSFAADEVGRDPQVVKRNNFMETLLSAREPLDW
ncbi:unnamed protein product, partial [Polarella glacialis]